MSHRETKEWRLTAYVAWTPKQPQVQIVCPSCGGKGESGGGFKDIDGSKDCRECFGRGHVMTPPPNEPMPEVPEDLIVHMQKAWLEYFKEQ